MKFSRWLNALSTSDWIAVILIFFVSGALALFTFQQAKRWYLNKQTDNQFALQMRLTPFVFFAITIPYTIILHSLFGSFLVSWLRKYY